MLSKLLSRKQGLPAAGEALPGRGQKMPVPAKHFVNGNALQPPFPAGPEQAVFGLGCFWGAERKFWQAPGVYTTAVGYAGGMVLGLKALLAAVAGGIGTVPGAFLGGILLGCTEALWSALFPIEFRDLAIFTLLVVLLVVRPSGLFGAGEPLPRKL